MTANTGHFLVTKAMVRFLRWLGSTVAGLVVLGTQIGPKEATSRLAEWAAFFGLENAPSWLSVQLADTLALWIGLLIIVGLLGGPWVIRQLKRTKTATENPNIHYMVTHNTYNQCEVVIQTTAQSKDIQQAAEKAVAEEVKKQFGEVQAFVKIDPKRMELKNASNVSSITDESYGHIRITFLKPIPEAADFTSTATSTSCISFTPNSARVAFNEADDVVEFKFVTDPSSGSIPGNNDEK